MRLAMALIGVLSIACSATAVSLVPGDILALYGDGYGVNTGIVHVDPMTNARTLVASGNFGDFAIAPNGSLYATAGDSVVRIDPTTGVQTIVSSGGMLVPSRPWDENHPGAASSPRTTRACSWRGNTTRGSFESILTPDHNRSCPREDCCSRTGAHS